MKRLIPKALAGLQNTFVSESTYVPLLINTIFKKKKEMTPVKLLALDAAYTSQELDKYKRAMGYRSIYNLYKTKHPDTSAFYYVKTLYPDLSNEEQNRMLQDITTSPNFEYDRMLENALRVR